MKPHSRKSGHEISAELRVEALEARRLAEGFADKGQSALDLLRYAAALELYASRVLKLQ